VPKEWKRPRGILICVRSAYALEVSGENRCHRPGRRFWSYIRELLSDLTRQRHFLQAGLDGTALENESGVALEDIALLQD
jgi:hypothetical protein